MSGNRRHGEYFGYHRFWRDVMRNTVKIATAACVLLALGGAAGDAVAKEKGTLLVRGRAIWVEPDISSSLKLGTAGIPGRAEAEFNLVPELDFSWFFTDNIAAELILATSPHEVTAKSSPLGASVPLGDVWVLPPTLTVQYHFNPKGQFSPYLGAGVNYTMYYGEDEANGVRSLDFENDFGFALQAGVDIAISDKWVFNVDVKKIFVNADATVVVNGVGTIKADVELDPWVFGVGFGYAF
jgi:outer membrane protein